MLPSQTLVRVPRVLIETAKAEKRARGSMRYSTTVLALWLSFVAFSIALPAASVRAATPEIRTSQLNLVPACVTPERLMAFLKKRNRRLDPSFEDIAAWYKHHGEAWRVRWDYAFFQMALETNFLSYRRGNGKWGDVDPRQNNFAGLGTTGGGVPGDRYPDVSTGVLAQIQHLVVYSGERIPEPVGHRTRLKQDHILSATERGGHHPMKFGDLAGRWAADKRYGRSIEWVAKSFRSAYCSGMADKDWQGGTSIKTAGFVAPPPLPVKASRKAPPSHKRPPQEQAYGFGAASAKANEVLVAPQPTPAPTRAAAAARAPTNAGSGCKVLTASYGGQKTLLLRSQAGNEIHLTALTILEGFEHSMLENYVRTYAPGSARIGEFETKDAALAKARELCRAAAHLPQHQRARAG